MMSQYSMVQPEHAYKTSTMSNTPWNPSRNSFTESTVHGGFDNGFYSSQRYGDSWNNASSDALVTSAISSLNYSASNYNLAGGLPIGTNGHLSRAESAYPAAPTYGGRPPSGSYGKPVGHGSYKGSGSQSWESHDRYSPTDSVDDIIASPNLSDYSLENGM
ncbi:hypothetical protein F66182_11023, partial [Fusarium sp. NRRL 66182]